MRFTVNGVARNVPDVAPLKALLHVLRDDLSITSPKAGCQSGGCGACTVLVDGRARRSCLVAAAVAEGAEITTVEGLAEGVRLSALQRSFHEHFAAQCGFCTSGMLIAGQALINEAGPVDRTTVAEALHGHVCRCTGYVKILDAVVDASAAGNKQDESA